VQQLSATGRLLMLELDSLSLSFIQQHVGQLPTFGRLLDAGEPVQTGTTADIASASVWPTFASGHLPGGHGRYFPFQWHAGKMRFCRDYAPDWRGALDYEPFWYELARRGVDSMVLDAVQSSPNPNPPCLEINDWSAQSSGHAVASDRQLLAELQRRFGRRPIGMEITVAKSRRLAQSLQRRAIDSLQRKADAIIWLGQQRPWRFYLASIQDAHRAGHNLWPVEGEFASDAPPDALLNVYRALDERLGRILQAFDDGATCIILFTLNGMGPNRAQNHFVAQVLHRLNRLYLTGACERAISDRRPGLMAQLRDRLPAGAQYAANRLLGERVQDWVVNRELTGGLDWAVTPSFAVASGGEGLIRLNISGREREGLLGPDHSAIARYVEWLRERLMAIRVTASGEPLIEEFILVHERYPGPRSALLPDIALKWAPASPATEICSDDIGTIRNRLTTGRGGNHTGESFALLTGTSDSRAQGGGLRHITDYRTLATQLLI
jgi:predicted AlkP superfamily phosphohydrolase/phosphomutase